MIPYGRQTIDENDVNAVIDVLRSDYLTQGNVVPEFESAVAHYCKVAHGVATNSATAALHVACLALDLQPGDLVWTTPITFVASANCALYCGADIDFVDIDPSTYTMSVSALRCKLELSEKEGRLPKIVIPVHHCGQSADMAGIHTLAKEYGFRIIEDASHAIGAQYHDAPVGNCQYSDIAVFSFHPVKIITSAEGGIAVTNSATYAGKMRLFRSHGITRDRELLTKGKESWYYEQIVLGYNYRMSDVHAALGLSQLTKLEKFIDSRHSIAMHYDTALSSLPLTLPYQHPSGRSAYHLYVIRVEERDEINRDNLIRELRLRGIGANVHYIPVYHQPYFAERYGFKIGYCPNAEEYYKQAISLPIFPSFSEEDQLMVVEVISQMYARHR